MERNEYEKPSLVDIRNVSYGICNTGTTPGTSDSCESVGSHATAACHSGNFATATCTSPGNSPGTQCDPTGNVALPP